MTTRRSFLQQTALLGVGALISPACFSMKKPFNQIGIQLYTLREEIEANVKKVIVHLGKSGYNDVETYGYSTENKYWGLDPRSFKMLLEDNGLVSSSGHYDLEQLIKTGKYDTLKSHLEAANILGQKNIVLPYLAPELRSSSDQYKEIANKLNKASEVCKSAGVTLSYHNHDFEFEKLADGTTGFDVLLKNTDPAFKFEMDIYWVVRAGQDPISLFKKYPGRFSMWHVKDMSKNNPEMETEIGKGTINFKDIFDHAKLAGAERFFVEQENNYVPDPFGSVAQSADYVKRKLM